MASYRWLFGLSIYFLLDYVLTKKAAPSDGGGLDLSKVFAMLGGAGGEQDCTFECPGGKSNGYDAFIFCG